MIELLKCIIIVLLLWLTTVLSVVIIRDYLNYKKSKKYLSTLPNLDILYRIAKLSLSKNVRLGLSDELCRLVINVRKNKKLYTCQEYILWQLNSLEESSFRDIMLRHLSYREKFYKNENIEVVEKIKVYYDLFSKEKEDKFLNLLKFLDVFLIDLYKEVRFEKKYEIDKVKLEELNDISNNFQNF